MVQGLSFYENGIESITVFKSACCRDGSLSMSLDGNVLVIAISVVKITQPSRAFVVLSKPLRWLVSLDFKHTLSL